MFETFVSNNHVTFKLINKKLDCDLSTNMAFHKNVLSLMLLYH